GAAFGVRDQPGVEAGQIGPDVAPTIRARELLVEVRVVNVRGVPLRLARVVGAGGKRNARRAHDPPGRVGESRLGRDARKEIAEVRASREAVAPIPRSL